MNTTKFICCFDPGNQVWLCGFSSQGWQKRLWPQKNRCGFVASTVEVAEKYFPLPKIGCGFDSRGCRKNFDPTKSGVTLRLCGFDCQSCRKIHPPHPKIGCGFVALWLRQSRLPKKTLTPQNQVWLCGFDCRGCRKILSPPKIRWGKNPTIN